MAEWRASTAWMLSAEISTAWFCTNSAPPSYLACLSSSCKPQKRVGLTRQSRPLRRSEQSG